LGIKYVLKYPDQHHPVDIAVSVQDRSIEAQKLALEKTPGLGSRIDIVLTLVRIGFFFGDYELITAQLKEAEKCVSIGKHSQILIP
jgi:hypothetical protein